jgi:hypothetical protein
VRPGSARLHVKISYMGLFGWYPSHQHDTIWPHQVTNSHQVTNLKFTGLTQNMVQL